MAVCIINQDFRMRSCFRCANESQTRTAQLHHRISLSSKLAALLDTVTFIGALICLSLLYLHSHIVPVNKLKCILTLAQAFSLTCLWTVFVWGGE